MRVESAVHATATADPVRVALVADGECVSYQQLWERASRIAGALIARGLPLGGAVAVIGRLSPDVVTTYLGVAIAGGQYVPIDPETPSPRITAMATASGAALLVRCDGGGAHEGVATVAVAVLAAAAPVTPRARAGSDDALYIMFTSGSTGVPKAVAVSHRAVTCSFQKSRTAMSIESDDRVLARSSVAFDAATFEVWGALLVGAQLRFPSHKQMDLDNLADLIIGQDITVAMLPSSLFTLVARDRAAALGSLRLLVVGGDVLSIDRARQMLDCSSHTELVNGYGPTEATVFSACFRVRGWLEADGASVPIGGPFADTSLYVLGSNLSPVPVGLIGELYLGGSRLADGYVGEPRGTAASFLPDPFSEVEGSRMYRTGDRVRELSSGDLEFHGRLDHEVKVRGFRVNLAEIDAVLRADPRVGDCASVAVGNDGERRVISFVVSLTLTPTEVRAAVLSVVPRHLVPEHVVVVDVLPTRQSKVDRAELGRRADALAAAGREEQPHGIVAHQSTPEGVLAQAWQRFTGASPEPGDDFFMSGGTSLGLMQLTNELRARAGMEIDFAELYSAENYEEVERIVKSGTLARGDIQ